MSAREPAPAAPSVICADAVHTGGRVLSPGWVAVTDGRVSAVGRGTPDQAGPEVRARSLRWPGAVVPGFVDLHVHGALGVDFATESDTARLRRAVDHHALSGATTLLASLATSSTPSTTAALARLSALTGEGVLAGVHLEGPFLNPSRRGAHQRDLLRPPSPEAARELLDAARGALRVMTLAPELPGAPEVVEQLVGAGVVVALGHSDADAATARRAVDAGARTVTHLFNGMAPLHHRHPGLAGVALTDDRLVVELVADGQHLAPEVLDIALAAAAGRTALVSDAMSATGSDDGHHAVGGTSVTVSGGVARTSTGSLAGSTTPLGTAALSLARRRGWDVADLLDVAVRTPRRSLGLPPVALHPGEPADLLLLAPSTWTLHGVMRRGQWLSLPS